ncbi:Rod shape-determining protein RodA [Paraliobacillus sp. PM-2]|uniref:FtsW/RodA/SpoVE family cell cycle protein n=1 Tax=Paraliobacillus sp. PM-2 TaxID=1462524 RepID=UPI00061BC15A|nr:FtsW/RodA/SpoVE family cell cycle protein [Paraliobacillus sp. PM-2]CQR47988.1 Rod shape-determining protein RodA [Paraliobacillus sp. PM-2]
MEKNTSPKIDYTLISIIILLGITSIFTLYTLEPFLKESFYIKQLVWYIGGSIVIGVIMLIDYDRLRQVSWILYGFGVLMLVMLQLHIPPGIANEVNGTWGWFDLGFISLQPAEFMKVFLIIILAHIIVMHKEKFKAYSMKHDLWLLSKIAFISFPPIVLIALQPDFGSALVLASIVISTILVSGIQWRIIFSLLGLAMLTIGSLVILYLTFPEQVEQFAEDNKFGHIESRINGWLNPNSNAQGDAYQLIENLKAIGSGQLSGKGIGGFEVSHIPERQTDFIFSAIAEQFGFIGSSVLLILFFILIYRLIHIGLQSNDPFGTYLITGMIGMFTYQIFQNIGMSINLLPITGVPLPFISYGGSSTLTYLITIGIVLNIHYRTKVYMFDS